MPELPDITVYVERLQAKLQGQVLTRIRILNPFVLRTAVPLIGGIEGRIVQGVERLGKRIVLVLDNGQLVVIHLMIAGRLRWLAPGAKLPGKGILAAIECLAGQLLLTEAGTQRRASIHLLADRVALDALNPGGLELLPDSRWQDLALRLRSDNHTLKRALTMPQLVSGVGNAYSDEILHRARLSPLTLTHKLSDGEIQRLHAAAQDVLAEWIARLREEAGDWPQRVTAFHPKMAVHGRYGQPCPECGAPVQRIVYTSNEANYCAGCQTGGRLLADRALSRLLKDSWPKTLNEL